MPFPCSNNQPAAAKFSQPFTFYFCLSLCRCVEHKHQGASRRRRPHHRWPFLQFDQLPPHISEQTTQQCVWFFYFLKHLLPWVFRFWWINVLEMHCRVDAGKVKILLTELKFLLRDESHLVPAWFPADFLFSCCLIKHSWISQSTLMTIVTDGWFSRCPQSNVHSRCSPSPSTDLGYGRRQRRADRCCCTLLKGIVEQIFPTVIHV